MAGVTAVGGLLGDSLTQVAAPHGSASPDTGSDTQRGGSLRGVLLAVGTGLVCGCVYVPVCVSVCVYVCMRVCTWEAWRQHLGPQSP